MLPPMAELLKRHLDGCLLVSDGEIRAAMRRLALEAKVVAEPAGAAAFAAWSRHRDAIEGPAGAGVSGGNVDPGLLREGPPRSPPLTMSPPPLQRTIPPEGPRPPPGPG